MDDPRIAAQEAGHKAFREVPCGLKDAVTAAINAALDARDEQIIELKTANNRASEALMRAARQFRFYAEEHTKKGAIEKAATNNGWADGLAREANEARGMMSWRVQIPGEAP